MAEVTFSLGYSARYGPLGRPIDLLMLRRLSRKAFDMALDSLP